MSIIIAILVLFGLFFLSLLLNYPNKKLFKKKPNPKHIPFLHLLGWGLCVTSLSISIQTFGLGIGIVYWFGYATLMAFF